INNSDSAISDVEVILDYTESLFEIEGEKIQKLGNIPPTVPRTAKFILKPLGCVHKEEIGATVRYKDHQWKKHVEEMRPKEVHCVCPFLKEKSIKRADFLRLSNSGYLEERGVNFEGVSVTKLVDFIAHTCKNRLYKVDEFPIENGEILYLAGDAVGEKAYYLLTAVVKEYEGLTQVLLRASSDKSHGLSGFLNETLDNLRHLVISASAREIGIIKKEQVINIIDSVVQRSTISMEEGAPSIKIKDSMVQRTEIKGDEERKRREEQERLRRQKEQEERARGEKKAHEDAERRERDTARHEEERIAGEREELRAQGGEKGTSYNKFLIVALVLGVLLLGYWAPDSTNSSESSNSTPSPTPQVTTTILQTPTVTSTKTTTTASVRLKVVEEVFKGDVTAANKAGLEKFDNGYYYVVDWQGDKYVALKGKTTKLVKLILEQRNKENKALAIGETWDIGGGWTVTANSIDAKGYPAQVWLTLSKDGVKKDDKVISQGDIYTYVENNIGGEIDVPLFVTYIASVYAGATSDMVKLSYTWAVDTTIVQNPKLASTVSPTSIAVSSADQKSITNSIGMEFVLIPAGEFDMGSPSNEKDRYDDEGPVHRVKISKSFYMGKYEVTQKQWREVMGTDPSHFKGDNLPVESVGWNSFQEFIRKLNEKEGTNMYRLPSEAEWEYAARAGTTTGYSFGYDISKLGEYAWYNANSGDKTHEIGQKNPNPWGLYDVHGNVWEWVQDIYHDSYNGAPTDGSAWESGGGSGRVFRGGGWNTPAGYCRSAHRGGNDADVRASIVGFRLLRDV
ncbi:MAG: SUMF1/EgtB/PvdO family nonheme iron enzyme, partial [Candidatus Methanoperedens sp.]